MSSGCRSPPSSPRSASPGFSPANGPQVLGEVSVAFQKARGPFPPQISRPPRKNPQSCCANPSFAPKAPRMNAQPRNSPTNPSPIKAEHKQTDLFVIQSLGVSARPVRTALLFLVASALFHFASPDLRAEWPGLTPKAPPDTVTYTVRVLDAQQKPIDGLRVSATWVSGPTRRANTDKTGTATLKLPGRNFSSIYVSHLGARWSFARESIPESGVLILDPKTAIPSK